MRLRHVEPLLPRHVRIGLRPTFPCPMIAPKFGRPAAVTYDEYPAAYSRSENEFIGRSPECYIFNHISDLEKFQQIIQYGGNHQWVPEACRLSVY
jgi:hypothetical protein